MLAWGISCFPPHVAKVPLAASSPWIWHFKYCHASPLPSGLPQPAPFQIFQTAQNSLVSKILRDLDTPPQILASQDSSLPFSPHRAWHSQ